MEITTDRLRSIPIQIINTILSLLLSESGQISVANTLYTYPRRFLYQRESNIPRLDRWQSLSPEKLSIATPTSPAIYISNNSKINNDLNLPKTGGEVQITGKQSITLQQAIEIALSNNREIQTADSSVIIDRASIADATRSLSDAQLQDKAGTGTRFDVLRAQVQLATANQNLVNAQGQQQTARKNIAQLLSVDNHTEFTAADTVRELGTWGYSLEDSIVLAYKNRPEILQKLANRNISSAQQIVAGAADAPQVSLFANYNLSKTLTNDTLPNFHFQFTEL